MSKPETTQGGRTRLYLGSGTDPIVYTMPCGLTEKQITFTKSLTEVQIPDCDDPDAVDWVARGAQSLSMSISGSGVLAKEAETTWWEAFKSIDSVPMKIEMKFKTITIVWTGVVHIDNLAFGATNGNIVDVSINLQSDGEMVRTTEEPETIGG